MKITTIIVIAFGIAVFGVMSFLALQSFNRYIDVLAINGCTADYRQQIVKADKTTVTRPMEQQVRECAWNKGVRTWNGVWSDLTTK